MKILNFGSINYDYVYSVEKLALAGETVAASSLKRFCGGKGLNQSVALANAGAEVFHCGKTGKDDGELIGLLKSKGVNTDFIMTCEEPSGHAIIAVEPGGQNTLIYYPGANETLTETEIENALNHMTKGDTVLLQNEVNHIENIICSAHERGLKVVLNPSPINEALLKAPLSLVDIFILNEVEGERLSGEKNPGDMTEKLSLLYPDSIIVLTLGKSGVIYKEKNVTLKHGAYRVDAVDVTAAGDTFTGFFLAAKMQEYPVKKALEYASKAAAICVSKTGAAAAIPTLQDVINSELLLI